MAEQLVLSAAISVDVVAWYGAIVATASAMLSGYVVWRDRVRLKVVATPNMRLTEACGNFSTDEDVILIEAANVGRRSITLETTWFELRKSKSPRALFVKSQWRPSSKLAEGEKATKLCKQRDLDLSTLSCVVVKDATGRKWRGKIERSD